MTDELRKKVDDFTDHILMDAEDYGTCEGLDAKTIVEQLWDILPTGLRDELRIETYKEALKANPTFFDDADTGYCPDDMVEGWGDVYLVKVEDGYILSDCTKTPAVSYKVER